MEYVDKTMSSNLWQNRYSLKWSRLLDHQHQKFNEYYEKQLYFDVTLVCQSQYVRAHRIILGSCSEYFEEIFYHQKSVPHPVIIMANGIRFQDIQAIVKFMYKGDIDVNAEDLERVLETARSLKVEGLSSVKLIGHAKPNSNNILASATNFGPLRIQERKNLAWNNVMMWPTSEVTAKNYKHNIDSIALNCNKTSTGLKRDYPERGGNSIDPVRIPVNAIADMANKKRRTYRRLKPKNEVNTCTNGIGSNDGEGSQSTRIVELPVDLSGNKNLSNHHSGPGQLQLITQPVNSGTESGHDKSKKVRRPMNAFMMFAAEWRKKIQVENPTESNKNISIYLGEMWKQLPRSSKDSYFAASKEASENHKKMYPDYHYSPKEAREKKQEKICQKQFVEQISSNNGYYPNPLDLLNVCITEGKNEGEGNSNFTPNP